MSKLQVPVSFPAEFRGREGAKSFADRETGELVNIGQALKFERETPDGDAIPIVVRERDELHLGEGVDLSTLKKGDVLLIEGEAVLPEKFPGYLKVYALRKVGARDLKAAS
jgi:hypothetical protein